MSPSAPPGLCCSPSRAGGTGLSPALCPRQTWLSRGVGLLCLQDCGPGGVSLGSQLCPSAPCILPCPQPRAEAQCQGPGQVGDTPWRCMCCACRDTSSSGMGGAGGSPSPPLCSVTDLPGEPPALRPLGGRAQETQVRGGRAGRRHQSPHSCITARALAWPGLGSCTDPNPFVGRRGSRPGRSR